MAILIVTGLAGIGKDTVCNRVAAENKNWKIFPFGTTMKEKGLKHGIFTDKTDEEAKANGRPPLNDQIRKLPFPVRLMLQGEVFDVVAKEGNNYNIILNTHAIIPNDEVGLSAGLPFDNLAKLKGIPVQFVFLTTTEDEIASIALRSSADNTRVRDERRLDELLFQERMSLGYLAAASAFLNMNLKRVLNPFEKDEAKRGLKAAEAIGPCLRNLEKMADEFRQFKLK